MEWKIFHQLANNDIQVLFKLCDLF